MTTLSIDTVAFEVAADAAHQANTDLGTAYTTLTTTLAATAAMAGTDTPAAAFAEAYDHTAQDALDQIADLVTALAGLAHATDLTRFHHLAGDAAAHPYAVLIGMATDPGTLLGTRPLVDPTPASVPASLGGDPTTLPGWANAVLDHVGGFIWPDARTDVLRSAGTAWQNAADAVATVPGTLWMASSNLEFLRSPEIPHALDRFTTAQDAATTLRDQLTALAQACTDYADAVDEQRQHILDLAHDLLRDTMVMQAGGLLLDLVSGVGGTAAASAAALAEISARAPEFARILETLLDLARGCATTLHEVGSVIGDVGVRLRELMHLRWVGEGGGELSAAVTLRAGWLQRFEEAGGHIERNHVGLSRGDLLKRLANEPRLKSASSFADEATAGRELNHLLEINQGKVEAWLAGTERSTKLEGPLLHPESTTGVNRAGETMSLHHARVILIRDPNMPEGFRALTEYPY